MYIEKFKDSRGMLIFPVRAENFMCKESTISINNKNVFRGIHIEEFEKLVVCISGRVLDIIINFNEGDDDYLLPTYRILDPNIDSVSVLVRKNHGHAFLSLEDQSTIVYYFSESFDPIKTRKINFRDPLLGIDLPITDLILSKDDNDAPFLCPVECIIYGSSGFIGSILLKEIKKHFHVYCSKSRLEDIETIRKEIMHFRPLYIINCAGISTPTSWCEDHKTETIETNVVHQLTLASLCRERDVHLTVIGSGVIFQNDYEYTESDRGNFFHNFYSECRIHLENMIRHYPNVLYLRVNYPISHVVSPKNLLTRILSFSTIHNHAFSITYLEELVSVLPRMMQNKECGICNFVNRGTISMKYILDTYNLFADNVRSYTVQSTSDQKSHSRLSIGMLEKYGDFCAETAVRECIIRYLDDQRIDQTL